MLRRRLRELKGPDKLVAAVVGGAAAVTVAGIAGIALLARSREAQAATPPPAPTPTPTPMPPPMPSQQVVPAPAAAAPTPGPATGFGTTLCSETDLPPYLQGLVATLRTNPSVTSELLDSWGNYFDKMCPIVGADLHQRAISLSISQFQSSIPLS